MIYLNSKFVGLKMVIRGAKRGKDDFGNPTKIPGMHIQFEAGKYKIIDPKELNGLKLEKLQQIAIAKEIKIPSEGLEDIKALRNLISERYTKEKNFIEKYMKSHQGEITIIDEKKLEIERRVRARLQKEIEKEVKKEYEAEGLDEYGNEIGKSEIDDSQPDDETRPTPQQASEFMNMSLKNMQKRAKKMKLGLNKEEMNDPKVLKAKLIQALKEENKPNLDDQSEE